MEPLTLSWLVLSAAAPLAALLECWSLFVCHSYRKRWATLDLLVVGLLVSHLVSCALLTGQALIHVLPAADAPVPDGLCGAVTWGLVAARTLQGTVLLSFMVDRTLVARCRYRYRLSVRANQVRYHLVALSVIAALVGVAAIFARASPARDVAEGTRCAVLPFHLDAKFALFVVCLQGSLMLGHVVCAVCVQVQACCQPGGGGCCSSGGGANRPVHNPFSSSQSSSSSSRFSRKRMDGGGGGGSSTSDARWTGTVVPLVLVAVCSNHIPYLAVTVLETFVVRLTSPWLENGSSWLALCDALLCPVLLFVVDRPHARAFVRRLRGRSSSSAANDDSPSSPDMMEGGGFRYPGGIDLPDGKVGARSPLGGAGLPSVGGGPGPPGFKHRDDSKALWGNLVKYQEAFYGTILPPSPVPHDGAYTDTITKMPLEIDPIYATLSTAAELSTSDDDSDSDCSSLGSMAADDDFEYHIPKSNQMPLMTLLSDVSHDSARDTLSSQATTASINSNTYRVRKPRVPLPMTAMSSLATSCRRASVSLNDLDLVGTEFSPPDADATAEEVMLVLPDKSESTLSLYRIPLDENEAADDPKLLQKARSEGNLHHQAPSPAPPASASTPQDKVQPRGNKAWTGHHQNNIARRIHKRNKTRSDGCGDEQRRRLLKVSFLDKSGSKRQTITVRDTPMTSVDELLRVLQRAKFSYLDNGDLCWHYVFDGSETEAKKVFITEYI